MRFAKKPKFNRVRAVSLVAAFRRFQGPFGRIGQWTITQRQNEQNLEWGALISVHQNPRLMVVIETGGCLEPDAASYRKNTAWPILLGSPQALRPFATGETPINILKARKYVADRVDDVMRTGLLHPLVSSIHPAAVLVWGQLLNVRQA